MVARLYNKTERHLLDSEAKQAFINSATGFVLSKKNKLRTLSTREDDDGILAHVTNLKNQLRSIQDHLVSYDMADVFSIIGAHDIEATGSILSNDDGTPHVSDLFTDYPRLHVAEVTTSNVWYNTWVVPEQPYVKENLKLSLDFLQNNTDESLWSKCMEDYMGYKPIQQGGPLMFHLLLNKIQNSSESAVEHLRQKVAAIRINKVQGEDVEIVCSQIKSAAIFHDLGDVVTVQNRELLF